MNFPFMVNGNAAADMGFGKCSEKKSGDSEAFEEALMEMMSEGNTQISIKQVSVTGTAVYGTENPITEFDSLKEISERLDYMLDRLFMKNGIPRNPLVEISYSYTKTEVVVTGDREDIEQIAEMINSDSDIVNFIKGAMNVASDIINMAETLAFQGEYAAGDDAEDLFDRYAFLFDENRSDHKPSIRYGEGIDILSDGKTYSL
ncbi:MAG: hypothetical protein AB7E76_06290 [Deferribacterales bacterium]